METRVYPAFVGSKHRTALIYSVVAIAFISAPIGAFIYYRFGLSSHKDVLAPTGLVLLGALGAYAFSLRTRLLFDGRVLLYEKAGPGGARWRREQLPITRSGIEHVTVRTDESGHQGITIECVDGYRFDFAARSEDAAPLLEWLTGQCENKITRKEVAASDGYRKGFLLIGVIVLDIVLIFVAVHWATR